MWVFVSLGKWGNSVRGFKWLWSSGEKRGQAGAVIRECKSWSIRGMIFLLKSLFMLQISPGQRLVPSASFIYKVLRTLFKSNISIYVACKVITLVWSWCTVFTAANKWVLRCSINYTILVSTVLPWYRFAKGLSGVILVTKLWTTSTPRVLTT